MIGKKMEKGQHCLRCAKQKSREGRVYAQVHFDPSFYMSYRS